MPYANIYRERFLDKTQVGGLDECWPWLGSSRTTGYGQTSLPDETGKHRTMNAHRAAYNLFVKELQRGVGEVCHTCDNRICVNYKKHLFYGTKTDNMQDMAKKGRANMHLLGNDPHNRILTLDIANEIRRCFMTGETSKSIALRFGVYKGTVSNIMSHNYWPDPTMPTFRDLLREKHIGIMSAYKRGLSSYEVAKLYGVSRPTVMNVVKQKYIMKTGTIQ